MPEGDPALNVERVKAVLNKIEAKKNYEPAFLNNFSKFVAKRPHIFAEDNEGGELIESSVKSCLKFYADLHEFHEGDVVEVEKSLDKVNHKLTKTLIEKKMADGLGAKHVKIIFG